MGKHRTEPQLWEIYYLPNEPKVGMSTNIKSRIEALDRLGYNTTGMEIIDSIYGTRKEAELLEVEWQAHYKCIDQRASGTGRKISDAFRRRQIECDVSITFRDNDTYRRSNAQREVMQFDLDMNLIAVYDSVSVASQVNDVTPGAISSALTGRQRTCVNSIWMFKPEHLSLPMSIPYIRK
jgi:hypothetical protein